MLYTYTIYIYIYTQTHTRISMWVYIRSSQLSIFLESLFNISESQSQKLTPLDLKATGVPA